MRAVTINFVETPISRFFLVGQTELLCWIANLFSCSCFGIFVNSCRYGGESGHEAWVGSGTQRQNVPIHLHGPDPPRLTVYRISYKSHHLTRFLAARNRSEVHRRSAPAKQRFWLWSLGTRSHVSLSQVSRGRGCARPTSFGFVHTPFSICLGRDWSVWRWLSRNIC